MAGGHPVRGVVVNLTDERCEWVACCRLRRAGSLVCDTLCVWIDQSQVPRRIRRRLWVHKVRGFTVAQDRLGQDAYKGGLRGDAAVLLPQYVPCALSVRHTPHKASRWGLCRCLAHRANASVRVDRVHRTDTSTRDMALVWVADRAGLLAFHPCEQRPNATRHGSQLGYKAGFFLVLLAPSCCLPGLALSDAEEDQGSEQRQAHYAADHTPDNPSNVRVILATGNLCSCRSLTADSAHVEGVLLQ